MEQKAKSVMANTLPQFDRFSEDDESWASFKSRFSAFVELSDYPQGKLALCLLAHLTPGPYSKLRDQLYPEEPTAKTYEELLNTLDKIYMPGASKWLKRMDFRDLRQESHESLQDFARRLRRGAEFCDWLGDVLSSNLLEQFFRGVCDEHVREHVVHKADSLRTIDDAVHEAQSVAIRKQRLIVLNTDTKKSRAPAVSNTRPERSKEFFQPGKCYRCGNPNHIAKNCPHRQSICRKCGKTGHLKKVCQKTSTVAPTTDTSTTKGYRLQVKSFHMLAPKGPGHAVRTQRPNVNPIYVSIDIEGVPAQMELDSGCGATLMPLNRFRAVNPKFVHHSPDLTLCVANGEEVVPHSFVEVNARLGEQQKLLRLYLVDDPKFPMLFGRDWMQAFEVTQTCVHRVDKKQIGKMLEAFPKLTSPGVGTLPSPHVMTVEFKSDPKPVFFRPRSLPYALADAVKLELRTMLDNGLLEQVQHSEWAHPIVPVMKSDGGVRICVDLKVGLNQQVKQLEYKMPTVQGILDGLGRVTVFSKIDIASAFMHVRIDPKHRKYFTINTPIGLCQLTRMPFGYVNAPLIWQQKIDSIVAGIPGVHVFYDDILLATATESEHTVRLRELLQRLSDNDLRINLKKSVFFQSSVTYCGFHLSERGVGKMDEKVRAIQAISAPKNVSELRSFLGLVQFYGSFMKRLADIAEPLYRLLKKDVPYNWLPACQAAFDKIKSKLASDKTLMMFNPKLPLVLATDASPVGISAILSHRLPDGTEKPIAYHSAILNSTQRRYTQLDREALAIKEGIKKFQVYLFGRRFTLVTDSKPLLSIFAPSAKLPPLTSARLQHYAIFLQAFTYNIEYRPTGKHGNVDALSRLPQRSEDLSSEAGPLAAVLDSEDIFYCRLADGSPVNVTAITQATREDTELNQFMTSLKRHRATSWTGVSGSEFTIANGCLYRGHRIVIPTTLRKTVLSELHCGHFGIVKMKALARQHCWWPGIDRDIEGMARSCQTCMLTANNPPKMTVHAWEPPSGPWQRIHVDYAGPINGTWYLIIVDAFSKWIEVYSVKSHTSAITAAKLDEAFSRYGYPFELVSDNAANFCSREFSLFLKQRGIKHRRSAPFHPATNGQAERAVQMFKKGLRKIGTPERKPFEFNALLLRLRNQPSATTGKSPAELLLGRPLRDRLSQMKEKQTESVTCNTPQQSRFSAGERVAARSYAGGEKWLAGRIEKVLGRRHLLIRLPNGELIKRHLDQVRKTLVDTATSRYDLFTHLECGETEPTEQRGKTSEPAANGHGDARPKDTEEAASPFDLFDSLEGSSVGEQPVHSTPHELLPGPSSAHSGSAAAASIPDPGTPLHSTPLRQQGHTETLASAEPSSATASVSPRGKRKRKKVDYRLLATRGRME